MNTVIFFSGNYAATTLGFSEMELLIFFIVVQTTAILGSVLFGIIADKIGQKKTIVITLFMWLVTVALAFFVYDKTGFYIVGLIAGSAMGSSQSTSRSLMSKLTPPEKKNRVLRILFILWKKFCGYWTISFWIGQLFIRRSENRHHLDSIFLYYWITDFNKS